MKTYTAEHELRIALELGQDDIPHRRAIIEVRYSTCMERF